MVLRLSVSLAYHDLCGVDGEHVAHVTAAAAVGFSKTSKTPSDFAGTRLGQLDQLRPT